MQLLTVITFLLSFAQLFDSIKSQTTGLWLILLNGGILFVSSFPLFLGIYEVLTSERSKALRCKYGLFEYLYPDNMESKEFSKKRDGKSVFCNPFRNRATYCTHNKYLVLNKRKSGQIDVHLDREVFWKECDIEVKMCKLLNESQKDLLKSSYPSVDFSDLDGENWINNLSKLGAYVKKNYGIDGGYRFPIEGPGIIEDIPLRLFKKMSEGLFIETLGFSKQVDNLKFDVRVDLCHGTVKIDCHHNESDEQWKCFDYEIKDPKMVLTAFTELLLSLGSISRENRVCCFFSENGSRDKRNFLKGKNFKVRHCLSLKDILDGLFLQNMSLSFEDRIGEGVVIFEGKIESKDKRDILNSVKCLKDKILSEKYSREFIHVLKEYLKVSKYKDELNYSNIVDSLLERTGGKYLKMSCWKNKRLTSDISKILEVFGFEKLRFTDPNVKPTILLRWFLKKEEIKEISVKNTIVDLYGDRDNNCIDKGVNSENKNNECIDNNVNVNYEKLINLANSEKVVYDHPVYPSGVEKKSVSGIISRVDGVETYKSKLLRYLDIMGGSIFTMTGDSQKDYLKSKSAKLKYVVKRSKGFGHDHERVKVLYTNFYRGGIDDYSPMFIDMPLGKERIVQSAGIKSNDTTEESNNLPKERVFIKVKNGFIKREKPRHVGINLYNVYSLLSKFEEPRVKVSYSKFENENMGKSTKSCRSRRKGDRGYRSSKDSIYMEKNSRSINNLRNSIIESDDLLFLCKTERCVINSINKVSTKKNVKETVHLLKKKDNGGKEGNGERRAGEKNLLSKGGGRIKGRKRKTATDCEEERGELQKEKKIAMNVPFDKVEFDLLKDKYLNDLILKEKEKAIKEKELEEKRKREYESFLKREEKRRIGEEKKRKENEELDKARKQKEKQREDDRVANEESKGKMNLKSLQKMNDSEIDDMFKKMLRIGKKK